MRVLTGLTKGVESLSSVLKHGYHGKFHTLSPKHLDDSVRDSRPKDHPAAVPHQASPKRYRGTARLKQTPHIADSRNNFGFLST